MIGRIRRGRVALWLAATPVVAGMTLWGVGAILYSPIPGGAVRGRPGALLAGTVFAFLVVARRRCPRRTHGSYAEDRAAHGGAELAVVALETPIKGILVQLAGALL